MKKIKNLVFLILAGVLCVSLYASAADRIVIGEMFTNTS